MTFSYDRAEVPKLLDGLASEFNCHFAFDRKADAWYLQAPKRRIRTIINRSKHGLPFSTASYLGRSYSAFLKAAHLPGDVPFVELDYYKRTWLTKDLRKVKATTYLAHHDLKTKK